LVGIIEFLLQVKNPSISLLYSQMAVSASYSMMSFKFLTLVQILLVLVPYVVRECPLEVLTIAWCFQRIVNVRATGAQDSRRILS